MLSLSETLAMLNSDARTAISLDAQAMEARERKDWLAADRLYRQCHDVAAKLKEPRRTHFQAGIEIRWASVLHRLGRLRSAEDFFREGLVKADAVNLRLYPAYNFAYMGWAGLCMDEDRFPEAIQLYRKVVSLAEQNQDAGGLVFGLQRLADALLAADNRTEAEEVVNRTMTLETQVVHAQLIRSGKNPAQHQITSMSLPDLHFARGQYEDARRLYRDKVDFWEKQVTRPDNIDVGRLQMRLAFSQAQTGHSAEAIEYYSRAEATYEREWCEGHPKALAARRAKAALAGKAAVA
jgi:tetratricopeptide (TPR) repeat protein